MSETVMVALIAVIGTLASGVLSYVAARRSTEVELKAIEAEMQRLRASQTEEHRRERQNIYRDLITAIDTLGMFVEGWGEEQTREAYNALTREYTHAHTSMLLLGDEDVVSALRPVNLALSEFGERFEQTDPSKPLSERLQIAYQPVMKKIVEGEGRLINAMKDDIAAALRAEWRARGARDGSSQPSP
jgi:hypothetical protein